MFLKMEGCGRYTNYVLVVFNGLFMIFGVVIIATACTDMGMIQAFADMQTGHETDTVLIAVGVLIILVTAFGCVGAWKESPKLLYIFAGLLIIIIVLELTVAIAAAALRPQIEESMKDNLRESFIHNKSLREENVHYRTFWDRIQSNLQCCGITGPDDYRSNDRGQAPINPSYSCCLPDNSTESSKIKRFECLNEGSYYEQGCEDKVISMIHGAGRSVIVCGLLFCFLEVAGILLALRLAHAIKPLPRKEPFKADIIFNSIENL